MTLDSPESSSSRPSQDSDSDAAGVHRRGFLIASGAALAGGAALASAPVAQAAAAAPAAGRAASVSAAAAPPPATHADGDPDLGPNVYVFDSSTDTATIQATLDAIFAQQKSAEFGTGRYAVLFKPGGYDVDVNLGYYTQVAGLGAQPPDVTISDTLHVDGDAHGKGTLTNFWRGAENLHPVPPSGTDRWAVSQATFYRRIYLTGNLQLDDGGYSSGGFVADSLITGQVISGTQQQWITRNSVVGNWLGFNWNIVFVGTDNAPATSFPSPPFTNVPRTPVVREKPFVYVAKDGMWNVFVPAVRKDSHNTSWEAQKAPGTSIPLSDFFVVQAGATAADMNAALAQGKHLLITPGVYHLSQALKVTKADTVVLGLGLATLVPDGGVSAIEVDDVDGVKIAGLLVDAGTTSSDTLVRIGPAGSRRKHAANPTSLHDVFTRIGGAGAGKAKVSILVNSNDVIIDNTWLWRADHGKGVGWTSNTSETGLVVNGDDVTVYGLFVEHHQKAQVLWNGERGRTYFFQNEMPYDPPNQAAWMEGTHRGYPSYEVAEGVREHEAWGLGSYCNLTADPTIVADRAFAAPRREGVRFHSMLTFSLGGGKGTIAHVINTTGSAADGDVGLAKVTSYP